MRCVITGVAGFIGSHLAKAALARGDEVVGIDCVTPYYSEAQKRANLSEVAEHGSEQFRFVEADLRLAPLAELLADAEVVFHLAGQPGVRGSWAEGFGTYVDQNVLVTQRILEACLEARPRRFVYASSSSVYGNAGVYPTPEDTVPSPVSPYGVTKLAGEHLCGVYDATWGLSTCALRYFTVYGPGQRPDMAIHRFIKRALDGEPIPQFGDGSAVRDFTYVADIVEATLRAGDADLAGRRVMNVAGGSSVTVSELVRLLGDLIGRPLEVDLQPTQAGDVAATGGDISAAKLALNWDPGTDLLDGLSRQIEWHTARRRRASS